MNGLHPAQRGVALVVMLVVLAAAGLAAAASLRSVQRADAGVDAQRAVAAAQEASRLALRHCERALLAVPPALAAWPAPSAGEAPAWQSPQAWWGPAPWADSVPDDVWAAGNHGGAADTAPQCLAQWQPGPAGAAGERPLQVVARGRSPDHVEDDDGLPLQGAQDWRQASLLLAPPPAGAASEPAEPCEAPCGWRVVDRLEGAIANAPLP